MVLDSWRRQNCDVRTLPVLVWITMEQCSSDVRMDVIELGICQPLKALKGGMQIDSGKSCSLWE